MKLPIETLDEIFRFTDKPQFVLYFKKLMSRHSIRVLYKNVSFDTQATKGNLQTIKYLYNVGSKYSSDIIGLVSSYGHLEVIQYLHEIIGVKCPNYSIVWAGSYGHLNVIKYLHETVGNNYNRYTIEYVINDAIKNGHLEVVRYLNKIIGDKCCTFHCKLVS